MISMRRLKVVVALTFVVSAGWLAVSEIKERSALASKQLAIAAREAIDRGEHDLAMLLALEGLPAGKGQLLPMDSLQARFVLNEARQKNRLIAISTDTQGRTEVEGKSSTRLSMPIRTLSLDGTFRILLFESERQGYEIHVINTEREQIMWRAGPIYGQPDFVSLSPKDGYLIAGRRISDERGKLDIWSVHTGEKLRSLERQYDLNSNRFALNEDESLLFVADLKVHDVRVWEPASDNELDAIRYHEDEIVLLTSLAGQNQVASVSREGRVLIMSASLDEDNEVRVLSEFSVDRGVVTGATQTEDGRKLLVSHERGGTSEWSLTDKAIPWVLKGRRYWEESIQAFLSEDEKWALTLGDDNEHLVVDVKSREVLGQLAGKDWIYFRLSPQGTYLLAVSEEEFGLWKISDISAGERDGSGPVAPFILKERGAFEVWSDYFHFLADDILLLFDGSDGLVWRFASGESGGKKLEPVTDIGDVSGSILLRYDWENAKDGEGPEPELLDVISMKELSLIHSDQPWFDALDGFAFSENGRFVIGSYRKLPRKDKSFGETPHFALWRTVDGGFHAHYELSDFWRVFVGERGHVASFDADRGLLLIGDPGAQELREFDLSNYNIDGVLTIDDDRGLVALASENYSVLFFDIRVGEVTGELVGHKGMVQSLARSGDGRFWITASEDDTAGLWDVKASELLYQATGHEKGRGVLHYIGHGMGSVWDRNGSWTAKLRKGSSLLIGDHSALGIEVWDVSDDNEMIASACTSLPENRRRLTDAEYARYGIPTRPDGPCERVEPLAAEFWRRKAKSVGLFQ